MSLNDTMTLSEEEHLWAHAIKAAAANDEELMELSDYEYAHHAIVSRGNVQEALDRIRGMQYFREEYNIHDNPEEGLELFVAFMRKHPGFLLSVEWDANGGHFVVVNDYAKRRSEGSDFRFPEDWRIHLGGLYYLAQALTTHPLAIREGVVHIVECEGMGWNNCNRENHRREWEHLRVHYPIRYKEISWLRTPLAGNLLFAFLKPLMSENMKSKFQLGCTFHGYDGRIDDIFKQPTPEAAEAAMVERVHICLTMRYAHQQAFRLPDLPDHVRLGNADDEDEDDELEEEVNVQQLLL